MEREGARRRQAFVLWRITLLCLTQTAPPFTCPTGTRLERHSTADEIWVGCVDDDGANGPMARTQHDGGVIEAGRFERGVKQGPWVERGRDGALITREWVNGREGPIRSCPAGTRAKTRCVARCCDISARWCALPDGGLTGPWDAWTVEGRRVGSNLHDPSLPAPFRDLASVRDEPFELGGDDPR